MNVKLLKIREVAPILGLSPYAIRNMADGGDLPSVQIGARHYFETGELEAFIKGEGCRARSKPAEEGE